MGQLDKRGSVGRARCPLTSLFKPSYHQGRHLNAHRMVFWDRPTGKLAQTLWRRGDSSPFVLVQLSCGAQFIIFELL